MKKILSAILIMVFACSALIACEQTPVDVSDTLSTPVPDMSNEVSEQDVSVPDNTSDASTSDDTSNASTPDDTSDSSDTSEVSEVVKTVWYGQEELYQWYAENFNEYSVVNLDCLSWPAEKSYFFYHSGSTPLTIFEDFTIMMEEIFYGKDDPKYTLNGMMSNYMGTAQQLEYYGIEKEEYIEICEAYLEKHGRAEEGVKPDMAHIAASLLYDELFGDYWHNEFWDNPNYEKPEYDTYFTPIPEGDNHTSWYYMIDYQLIEFVGIDAFEEWIDKVPDEKQNIVEFIKEFDITDEDYKEIYEEYWTAFDGPVGPNGESNENKGYDGTGYFRWAPYNPTYLFGDQELQDMYFTVHPLD